MAPRSWKCWVNFSGSGWPVGGECGLTDEQPVTVRAKLPLVPCMFVLGPGEGTNILPPTPTIASLPL